VKLLNSVMILQVASEKLGKDRSGIDGRDTDGIEGIRSRADPVMLSIRLGVEASSHRTAQVMLISNANMVPWRVARIIV